MGKAGIERDPQYSGRKHRGDAASLPLSPLEHQDRLRASPETALYVPQQFKPQSARDVHCPKSPHWVISDAYSLRENTFVQPVLTTSIIRERIMNTTRLLLLAAVLAIAGCASTDPELSEHFSPVQVMQPGDPQTNCTDLQSEVNSLASDITILHKQINADQDGSVSSSIWGMVDSAVDNLSPAASNLSDLSSAVGNAGAASDENQAQQTAQVLQDYQQRRNFLMALYYKKCG